MVTLAIVAFLFLVVGVASYVDIPPETVKEFDVKAFGGRWYQTHASIFPNSTYQKNGFCLTADYYIVSDTEFKVRNSQNVGSSSGPLKQWLATATLPDTSYPGKWVLEWPVGEGASGFVHWLEKSYKYHANYWIIKLSTKNSEGLYEWAVVSAPFGYQVFIYARDINRFHAYHQENLLKELASDGFNTIFNKPLETYHGFDCVYASTVECEAPEECTATK